MITRRQILKSSVLALGALSTTQTTGAIAASSKYGIVGQRPPELKVDYWIDEHNITWPVYDRI